jgi:hypothetical protein
MMLMFQLLFTVGTPFWAMIFVDSSSTNNQVGANDLA